AIAALGVQQVEAHASRGRSGVELDRDGNQAEGDRARADGMWRHGRETLHSTTGAAMLQVSDGHRTGERCARRGTLGAVPPGRLYSKSPRAPAPDRGEPAAKGRGIVPEAMSSERPPPL